MYLCICMRIIIEYVFIFLTRNLISFLLQKNVKLRVPSNKQCILISMLTHFPKPNQARSCILNSTIFSAILFAACEISIINSHKYPFFIYL